MLRAMRRSSLALVALAAACGDPTSLTGPFDPLPLDAELEVGLYAPVHVARDRYGVAHIRAQTIEDAAFVQGYVMAHDRLPQMDILRRFGAGTLSELFGALDPSVIDTDLEMRVHRMRPLAEQAWEMLRASSDPVDRQIVAMLERFTQGVNAYAQQIRSESRPQGKWVLDPNILVSFDPDRFTPWHPVDSLVLGRFQAFSLSWTAPAELELTELDQKLRATFDEADPADAAAFARRGISRDLFTFQPIGLRSTIEGFPDDPSSSAKRPEAGDRADRTVARPTVSQAVLDRARTFFARTTNTGPFGSLGPHAFMAPFSGSNNWAVGPTQTGDGSVLLASDQHLQLPNPSIFYPTHIMVDPSSPVDGAMDPQPRLDVLGVTFPGIPGVILGANPTLAWAATVSYHDVNDIYLESIVPCTSGPGDCVAFLGNTVPIETFTEEIKIGAFGTITETRNVTYELVPHHGPIIPTIDRTRHELVPRTGTQAMSVKYTGYEPTFEIRALFQLTQAATIHEAFDALDDFSYGSQNWTMIDSASDIGWTTQAIVPLRSPAAYTWNAQTQPDGLAPFFVLPGDGSAERIGEMPSHHIPHARYRSGEGDHPPLVTANADPVGATFDNDPLGGDEQIQPTVDGRPLYVGFAYAAGLRHARIAELLDEASAGGRAPTLDDMARIQLDTHSTMGAALAPHLRPRLAMIDSANATADLRAYVEGLSPEDRARLAAGKALLDGWSFATPTGFDPAESIDDSAATAVFNAWMHFFVERLLADELSAADFPVWRIDGSQLARIVYALFAHPSRFVQSSATQQPILCDVMTDAGADDSCDKLVAQALVDAMQHLESAAGFGTADRSQWTWGHLHRLRISPLLPNPALELPGEGEPGFPKPGDNFVVNRSDQGWSDLDFSQSADGPAQRFLARATRGGTMQVKWALPGGVIYDSRSPHYRDLLDAYYLTHSYFDAPFQLHEIVEAGESRWLFR